jgi:hypothetical protein
VLALVGRERKVSFVEARRVLQTNGVKTYAVCCMSVRERGKGGISVKQHSSPFMMLLW